MSHDQLGENRGLNTSDLQTISDALRTLNSFALEIMTIRNEADLFWHVAGEVVSRLGFIDCVVYQANEEQSKLKQVAAFGVKNPTGRDITNTLVIPFGDGITGTAAQSKQPKVVDDLLKEPRYIQDVEPARSEICVPIIYDDFVAGVIDCEHPQPDAFDSYHLEILETVAAMTSAKLKLLSEERQSEQRYQDLVVSHRQLHELAERLNLATRSAGIGIWDYDVTTGIVEWNDEQLLLHGITREEFKGDFDSWASTIHPEDRRRAIACAEDSITRDVPFDTEFRIVTPSGETRHLKASAVVFRDAEGNAERMIGVNYDLSIIRKFQQEAASRQKRLEDLAHTVPGAIFRFAIDNEGQEQIEYMSEGCVGIWELSAEEIKGDPSPLWDVVHEEYRENMYASVLKSAQTLQPWVFEWEVTTRSGQHKWLQGRGWPRRLEDGGTEWSSLILDITKQVETQNDLIKSQEMFFETQKLDAVGKLTGGVAHDFNNLIAIVMGNLELMEENVLLDDRESFDAALSACHRAANLTQQLLAFGRRSPLRPEVFNFNALLNNFIELLRRTLPASIYIHVAPDENLWPVEIDPGLLENALLNLALNARDAMPKGGDLKFETRNVLLEANVYENSRESAEPREYVVIAVSDTGSGMPESVINSAFEPFFTTKEVGKGSGMGLAMVDGFVKQSGGFIRLKSEQASGTCVELYFPRAMANISTDFGENTDTVKDIGTEHVMLVEDDDQVRSLITAQLKQLGYKVSAYSNGADALAAFSTNRGIDLLLTDIVMPGRIQGQQLAQEVRRLNSTMAIVFMSGYPGDIDYSLYGLQHNVLQLSKPIKYEKLAKSLRKALSAN